MEIGELVIAVVVGLLAGTLAGFFGLGGGIVFVPLLTIVFGLAQVTAEGTSLLAIIPVAIVGIWRQWSYGNLQLRDGLAVGCFGVCGSVAGVAAAQYLPEIALRSAFALLLVFVAIQMVRRTMTI